MTTLHETAYPQLKIDPAPRELTELYSPTLDEMVFVSSISKRPLPRIALLIHLKIFQRLGYFVRLGDVPTIIREHIVQQTGVGVQPEQYGVAPIALRKSRRMRSFFLFKIEIISVNDK